MSAQFKTAIPVDLSRPPHTEPLPHQLALKDSDSFVLTALVYDSSAAEPTEVMAGTVTGAALRPDGATAALTGEKGAELVTVTDAHGNAWKATPCSVTVSQQALLHPGRVILSVKLTDEGDTTTVLTASFTVNRTNSDQIVDGGDVIITIDTLIDEIEDAAADAAQAKADAEAAEEIISKSPATVLQTDAQGVDLDITDTSGNVLARFADGHIRTKNFNSANIGSSVVARIANYTADLVLSDAQGNVVAEFDDGHIRTKGFNSADVADGLEVVHEVSGDDYSKTFAYDTTVSTKQTITGDFRQGDTILCHMSNAADDVTDESNTVLLTYGYVDANGTEHTLGQAYPYDFARFTLPEDATGIFGNFGTGLLPAGTYTCKFLIYKLSAYERRPHIVTVGADGRRMFTSVRAAMDSFSDNNAYNRYEIWVYPGTYNILADYTDDEISAEGFVGLWVKNGVTIIGQGHREDIILHGELDPDDYNLTKRNAISTLNMSGNCGLKHLTVTNQYLRYAVHDDHGSGFRQEQTRIVEDCKFRSVNAASGGIGQAAYGAGGHNNKKMFIRDCDLGDRFIIHNTPYMVYAPMTAVVENCTAQIVTLTDNNNTTYPWTMPTRVEFNNCNFDYVRHDRTENGSAPTMILTGVGSYDIKLDCEAGTLYNFGDCRIFPGTISAGQAVKMNNSVSIAATTSRADIYGISIGNDGAHTWVQRRGYIANTVLGLTGLSVGDYITINSSGVCVSGGTAENAIGVVECIDAQMYTAFIKLLF